MVVAAGLTALAAALDGELLLPGTARYAATGLRRTRDGNPEPAPRAVVRCRSAADVGHAVRFARSAGLPLA
ncbi:MAG TPA: hypothetical protein VGD67_13010, partial [Pseudonocardiaceae bacterium]